MSKRKTEEAPSYTTPTGSSNPALSQLARNFLGQTIQNLIEFAQVNKLDLASLTLNYEVSSFPTGKVSYDFSYGSWMHSETISLEQTFQSPVGTVPEPLRTQYFDSST